MTLRPPSDPRELDIADFDYPLPDERIARHPLAVRDACLLLERRPGGELADHTFSQLPGLLPQGALMVANDTRVINARLTFRKQSATPGGSPGARIEVFCLEPLEPADYERAFASSGSCEWLCLVGNSKKWKQGPLHLPVTLGPERTAVITAERAAPGEGPAQRIRFTITGAPGATFSEVIEAAGEIPIPPYLNRATEPSDSADYQTVFSHYEGSVAAPTAGLHFTPALLRALDDAGIRRRELTLHVGAGTFQPVKASRVGGHPMHSEYISAPRALIEELARGEAPVVAVGTTSVRTLESLYHAGCLAAVGRDPRQVPQWWPYEESHPGLPVREALEALLAAFEGPSFVAATRIIIAPGYRYRLVDAMITNFHQPRSTLLLLVSAFTGGDWRPLYSHALSHPGYRFLSYGDACLLWRDTP